MVFKNGLNDETISYAINITRGFTLNMYLVTQSTSKTIWNKKHSSAAMFFVDSRSGMAQNSAEKVDTQYFLLVIIILIMILHPYL